MRWDSQSILQSTTAVWKACKDARELRGTKVALLAEGLLISGKEIISGDRPNSDSDNDIQSVPIDTNFTDVSVSPSLEDHQRSNFTKLISSDDD